MKARTLLAATFGIALLVLGVMTLLTGGEVILGVEAAVAAHGDFVPFVAWGNVSLGHPPRPNPGLRYIPW